MKKKAFSLRLCAAQRATEMTVSDLARWFDRPRPTVDTWTKGRSPFGPAKVLAEKRLAMLELSIARRRDYWPVPAHFTWDKRQDYVRGLRDDAERYYSVPDMRAAG